MINKLQFAALIFACSTALAACGTAEPVTEENTEEVKNTAAEQTEEQSGDQAAADAQEAEPATEESKATEEAEPATESETAEDAAASEPANATSDTDTAEPEQTTSAPLQDAALTESDEQAYSIHVLPNYSLTSEEPNKDALYSTDDDTVFMRIETFSPEDADFSFLENGMRETLQAVGTEVTETAAFDDASFTKAVSAETMSETGKVTGVVFEQENLIVRLTIFDNETSSATDEFLAMGKTIERTQ